MHFERLNTTLVTCELKSVKYDGRQDFEVYTNHSVIEKIFNIPKIVVDDVEKLEEIEKTMNSTSNPDEKIFNISKIVVDHVEKKEGIEKTENNSTSNPDDSLKKDSNVEDMDDLVKQVKFKWSKLPLIPNQIFRKFKKLIVFDGSSIGLRNLNSLSFNGAGNLEMIFLQDNQLTSLNAYCFVHSKNLTLLNLSNNNINNIHGLAFTALNQLETLTLSKNNLKSIEDETFQSLTSLKWIGLDNNRLTVISSDMFIGMKETLKGIYLNNNIIEMISPHAFNLLLQLRFLTLSANRCVGEDFLNNVIHGNSAIKFELRRCFKEYRKDEYKEDDKYSMNISLERWEKANQACVYESMKILTELFDIQNQISNS